ncbi:hypothetical protein [Modestobacter excelsi]|uniref:hypothetical protein n=1 Tax=Modestobacter excelsi TaxID=2213161 RepID=UPI00110C9761|nr:hypothetical protein [Modestobacter excelsi]
MAIATDTDVLAPADRRDHPVYRLSPGTELLGEYRDSGLETPKYLVRRADGQVMQLPRLLYRVAGSLDGRDAGRIAEDLHRELEEELTAEHISFLVDERLRPVGIIAPDGAESAPSPVMADPLLALRYRVGVLPAAVSWRVAGLLRLFFARPVWVAALAVFVAVHATIVVQGGLLDQILAGVDQIVHEPELILAMYVLTFFLSGIWHEFGHVTACRYGGARPGDMGIGIYIVWPAFYSTVTDSYRLHRVGRLRTDLGGVYFDALFLTGLGLAYLYTGEPWLLLMLLGMLGETLSQFLPSIRLDGYFILADLVGVPDLFGYVWPAVSSLLPGRPTHPKVQELRPRARRVIIGWVALTVPLLALYLIGVLVLLPFALPVAWTGFLEYVGTLDTALRTGDVITSAVGVFQLFLLVLPWVGGVLMAGMIFGTIRPLLEARWGWAWTRRQAWTVVRRYAALGVLGGLAVALVWRVAAVATYVPASVAEARIASSAFGAPELGFAAAPDVAAGEVVVREQLMAYADLTGAFDRHADVLTGARELAVLATAVLVGCYLVLARVLRWRWWAIALPLAAVAAMGPAVVQLATVGPGIVGAAWAAVGGTLLLVGRHRRHGRHRPENTAAKSVMITLGAAAVAVGVATAPVLTVPLVVGAALLVLRPGDHPARASRWVPLVLGVLALTVLTTLAVPALLRAPAATTLSSAEWQVLVIAAVLVVVGGLAQPALRTVAAIAAPVVLLTLLPAPGADAVLPLAVCTATGLGALVVQVLTRHPVESRPHPLLRAALAVPVLVMVVVGALFLPTTAPALPHAQVADVLTDPASPVAAVAAPLPLWADLVRDGVPADRLQPSDTAAADATDWEIVVGEQESGPRERVVIGSGDTRLTVFWPR